MTPELFADLLMKRTSECLDGLRVKVEFRKRTQAIDPNDLFEVKPPTYYVMTVSLRNSPADKKGGVRAINVWFLEEVFSNRKVRHLVGLAGSKVASKLRDHVLAGADIEFYKVTKTTDDAHLVGFGF